MKATRLRGACYIETNCQNKCLFVYSMKVIMDLEPIEQMRNQRFRKIKPIRSQDHKENYTIIAAN